LKDIQIAIETAIGPVVNSPRAKLWLSPIVPDSSFIERWGKNFKKRSLRSSSKAGKPSTTSVNELLRGTKRPSSGLKMSYVIKWVENQLRGLETGRETQGDISKRAAARDEEAIEWVANQLRGLETGHETQCDIHK
jgi:hypothetical protein